LITYERIETDSPLYQAERDLRNELLLRPIGLPDSAWEMHDHESYHFVAVENKEVLGCVVLHPLVPEQQQVQLLQMAVVEQSRGRGVGRGLVEALITFARSEGYKEIICHARENAVGFYERIGFVVYGDEFEEVGVRHRHMKFAL